MAWAAWRVTCLYLGLMKDRLFVASLVVLSGLLLVPASGVAASLAADEFAILSSPAPGTSKAATQSAPQAPVMVEEAASPTDFGDEKSETGFRLSDTSENDPYHTMLREIVVGTAPSRQGARQAPTTTNDDTTLNFYSKEELKARIDAVKSGVASIFGTQGSVAQSDEARELELERRIAMRGAYGNTQHSATSGSSGGSTSAADGARRQQAADDDAARLYLADLLFFVWDIVTHPATIAALVGIALVRSVVFLMRFAPAQRSKRRHGKRRRSRSSVRSTHGDEASALKKVVAANIEAEKPKRRRRRKHRRSFFDLFRST